MTPDQLQKLSIVRYEEAEVLLRAGHYQGAVHLCGYVAEYALKRMICLTLRLSMYPEGSDYNNFRTHKLPVLLKLSGRESEVQKSTRMYVKWQLIQALDPTIRYNDVTKTSQQTAEEVVEATGQILSFLGI